MILGAFVALFIVWAYVLGFRDGRQDHGLQQAGELLLDDAAPRAPARLSCHFAAGREVLAMVEYDARNLLDRPLSTDALIVRGEACRRPERRNDMALLETRSGDAVMLDAHAVVLACLALGLVVKR